jgi:hypothetical protein
VNESPSAALRFDEPQLVEFVASWLVEFRPGSHKIGIWDEKRLGHQYEEHESFGYGQICRRDSHVCKLIDFKNEPVARRWGSALAGVAVGRRSEPACGVSLWSPQRRDVSTGFI